MVFECGTNLDILIPPASKRGSQFTDIVFTKQRIPWIEQNLQLVVLPAPREEYPNICLIHCSAHVSRSGMKGQILASETLISSSIRETIMKDLEINELEKNGFL